MHLTTKTMPLSDLKERLEDVVREVSGGGEPYVITEDGQAKAVVIDHAEWHKITETLAMLKIVNMGRKEIREGRSIPAEEAFARIRAKIAERRKAEA